jgi:hypothetical protein
MNQPRQIAVPDSFFMNMPGPVMTKNWRLTALALILVPKKYSREVKTVDEIKNHPDGFFSRPYPEIYGSA